MDRLVVPLFDEDTLTWEGFNEQVGGSFALPGPL
jgi:hypothetical protein